MGNAQEIAAGDRYRIQTLNNARAIINMATDQDTLRRERGFLLIADILTKLRVTLNEHPSRYFSFVGEPTLFVWLQRAGAAS